MGHRLTPLPENKSKNKRNILVKTGVVLLSRTFAVFKV